MKCQYCTNRITHGHDQNYIDQVTRKPQHTPTPLAVAIYQAMRIYTSAFGEEMHGTHPQIAAMLELGPMKPIVRAVNAHEELLDLARCVRDSFKFDERPDNVEDTIAKAEDRV